MDIVDTFNHLIPSDQLDESLVIGQNLECEASNEFGTGPRLQDSLKNMLSDKDPMFGCASAQFHLLDNEDPAFHIAGSASPRSGSASAEFTNELNVANTSQVKQPTGKRRKRLNDLDCDYSDDQQPKMSTNRLIRGRPRMKLAKRLSKGFLIEKGVKGKQLKKDLVLGGRININDLDGKLWLNPTVVLRRLTVTIGGFKIELLPGPAYTQSVDASQSLCFDDGFSFSGDIGLGILPDDAGSIQNAIPENVAEMDVTEKSLNDDATLGLGPYVNPNDVQTSNSVALESSCTEDTKQDDQNVPENKKPVSKRRDSVKHPQSSENDTAAADKTDDKEKHQAVAKTLLKSKQGPASVKNKNLVTCKTSHTIMEHKDSHNKPSKPIQKDLHKTKSKDKRAVSPLKRSAENTQSEPIAKMQKVHGAGDDKLKPKSPTTPNPVTKKSPSSVSRAGDHLGPAKQKNLQHHVAKAEPESQVNSHPGSSLKSPQEKFKMKKLEKLLTKHKSRNSRSISLEEPELFIPDNAPTVKKETVEEQPPNNEAIWDGNNCCGLCKKHHNNMLMVGCGRCDDWFHGDCVGLDLTKVREMEEEDQMYVCLKCCEEESKKVEPEHPTAAKPEVHEKNEVQDHKLPPKPRPGSSQALSSGGARPDPERRQSTDVKESTHKTGVQSKYEIKSKAHSLASKKPVSVDVIRRNVRDSLKEILTQRVKDSGLNVSEERASEVAKKTERELFHQYKDTDHKYKNKYRSLMFNLKDTKNNVLFRRVLKGEVSPGTLIRMSPEELASKELAAWRQRENRHTIEMIEKEQREVERRPITKITHKGEIEIESQEPMKAPEPVEPEPVPKVIDNPVEAPQTTETKVEIIETKKDTTSQHKSHLFDLHCKICTGRMAPPVEEAQTKVMKVATTVVRRQSAKSEESKSTPPPAVDDDLHLTVLEESFRNAQSGYDARSDHSTGRAEETSFLTNLTSLWRGFIHMHSVAKLVTKAFPVSGILDNLTEDLPDSIQVGGRISPQTVWDYFEKIRATGTKEVCLVRFAPETEEDEISYTLLYAYFSSRKRFGVVSNNLKQVKDMYLIPLGSTEKVPHQLVPFDGPGLENNRANLLLGLIIRQRPKRDFLPVVPTEAASVVPEIKPIILSTKVTRTTEEEEKLFLSSLTVPLKKELDKPLETTEDESVAESSEEPSATEEPSSQEPQKPLRFLPGVLVGWGGELPPLPYFGDKPLPTEQDTGTSNIGDKPLPTEQDTGTPNVGDKPLPTEQDTGTPNVGDKPLPTEQDTGTPNIQPAPNEDASTGHSKSPTTTAPRFVIKKKEVKPVKSEPELSSPDDAPASDNSSGKDVVEVVRPAPVSLKDKPPYVSTDEFLSSLSAAPETETVESEGNCSSQLESQIASDHTDSPKSPLSGILKKSSAYSSVNEDKPVVQQKDEVSLPDASSPKPVPVLSSTRRDPVLPFHQGYLQLSQARHKPEENPIATQLFLKKNDHGMVQPGATQSFLDKKNDHGMGQPGAVVTQIQNPPQVQESQDISATELDSVFTPAMPEHNSAAHSTTVFTDTDDSSSQASSGLQPQYPESLSETSGQISSLAKDYKPLEERYNDPWERPRNSQDRDHHGRHGYHKDSHHGKKSRHHDRERHGHDDKYRERNKHHSHSDSRYGERRKEKYHSNDYSGHHKDRHRHRRDSDYENGRRSSKDSCA